MNSPPSTPTSPPAPQLAAINAKPCAYGQAAQAETNPDSRTVSQVFC